VFFLKGKGRRGQDVIQGVVLLDGAGNSGQAVPRRVDLRCVEESKQSFGVTTSDSSLEHSATGNWG